MAGARPTVLVVDDDTEIRALVEISLRQAGFQVDGVGTGSQALQRVHGTPPDLVVLDLGLPDMDGTEVCRLLRQQADSYVLMLTGRAAEVDLLVGLAVGADGYLTKPFSPPELVARVTAMLRRPRVGAAAAPGGPAVPSAGASGVVVGSTVHRIGDLEVDLASREVRVGTHPLALTRTEFDLLAALASRPGRMLHRETLLHEVWHTDWEGSLRLVEAHMSNLRRKLADAGLHRPEIRTVRGLGYRLVG